MYASYYSKRESKTVKVPLSQLLRPTYTGSTQGTVEQLESELDTTRTAFGNLLELLVTRGILAVTEALEISGTHRTFIEYNYPDLRIDP